MICSSQNRDLQTMSVSVVGTVSLSSWRRKRVSGHCMCRIRVAKQEQALKPGEPSKMQASWD